MAHRITLSVDVASRDDRQAADWARKLDELLQHPMVRSVLESEGIVVTAQQVYQPQRIQPPQPPGTPARR